MTKAIEKRLDRLEAQLRPAGRMIVVKAPAGMKAAAALAALGIERAADDLVVVLKQYGASVPPRLVSTEPLPR